MVNKFVFLTFVNTPLLFLGSFVVLDTESLEEIVGYSHRKEEISDIKFSPGTLDISVNG